MFSNLFEKVKSIILKLMNLSKNNNENNLSSSIQLFKINSDEVQQALFLKLTQRNELPALILEYKQCLTDASNQVSLILEQVSDETSNIYKVLNSFQRIFNRHIQQLENHQIKLENKLGDCNSIEEAQEILFHYLKDNIEQTIIIPMINAIYKGISNASLTQEEQNIYKTLIQTMINPLFKQIGLFTINAEEKQSFNFDVYEPLPSNQNENVTNDPKLKECYHTIYQYAYVFDVNHVVSLGKATYWQYNN